MSLLCSHFRWTLHLSGFRRARRIVKNFSLPENFERWPPDIRQQFLEAREALWFPPKTQLRVPGAVLAKVKVRAENAGLEVGAAVILALEEWAARKAA